MVLLRSSAVTFRSRKKQGLPMFVEDEPTLQRIANILDASAIARAVQQDEADSTESHPARPEGPRST